MSEEPQDSPATMSGTATEVCFVCKQPIRQGQPRDVMAPGALHLRCRPWPSGDEPEALRDRFAMAALTGLLTIVPDLEGGHNETATRLTAAAYRFADAMMEARKTNTEAQATRPAPIDNEN